MHYQSLQVAEHLSVTVCKGLAWLLLLLLFNVLPQLISAFWWQSVGDDVVTGAGLLGGEGTRPGQLALAVYCQLEADVDDMLAAQAVKCLVHLSKEMLEADRAEGLQEMALHQGLDAASRPEANAAAGQHDSVAVSSHQQNGAHAADSETESDHEGERDRQELGQDGAPGLTLPGLVRRMSKMAGDR